MVGNPLRMYTLNDEGNDEEEGGIQRKVVTDVSVKYTAIFSSQMS